MKEPIRIIEADSDTMEFLDGSTLLEVIEAGTKLAVLAEKTGENNLGEFLILNVAVESKGLLWELCKKVVIRQWTKRLNPDRIYCYQCGERVKGGTYCNHLQENVDHDRTECDWHKAQRLKLEKFKMDGNI